MFQTYSYGDAFGFYLYVVGGQPAIDVAGRVAGSQDDRTEECLSRVGFDALYFIAFDEQGVHTGLEVNFAAALKDGVAHVLDDAGQFVGADVRVCVH